jgi:prepilin-type processing-associated H-X9-DG protein
VPSRGQLGDTLFHAYLTKTPGAPDYVGCQKELFWGSKSGGPIFDYRSADAIGANYLGFWGVIVRSNLHVSRQTGAKNITGFYERITFAKITDGSSNTLVLGEKRLIPSLYEVGEWYDDKGWSDGWDPDSLRSTVCSFGQDSEVAESGSRSVGFRFGSAHAGGMNAAMADASVRTINYEIEPELLNRLAHRSDDETITAEALQ